MAAHKFIQRHGLVFLEVHVMKQIRQEFSVSKVKTERQALKDIIPAILAKARMAGIVELGIF